MDKTVDGVLNDIINDWRNVAKEAVRNTAKRLQKDILDEADDYLTKYYMNYTPKIYNRTGRLKRAILPYWADRSNKNGISIEVGVQYKSSALQGAYKSNSKYHTSGDKWIPRTQDDFNFDSGDNGIPEPDWILDNFLKGEHGGYHKDNESTNSLMEKFFDTQAKHLFDIYIEDEFYNAIIKRF